MHRLLTLIFVTLLLAGCGTIDKQKKAKSLHNATRYYEHSLRWGDYEEADAMRKPGNTAISPDPMSLGRYKVTSYKLMDSFMSQDGTVVNHVVEIRYYNEDNMREKKLTNRQKWVYEEDIEAWYLDGPLPAFK